VKKSPKRPPPLVLHGKVATHTEFSRMLGDTLKSKFYIKYYKDYTEVYTSTTTDFKLLKQRWQDKKVQFHTYTEKQERRRTYVIRGLHKDTDVAVMKKEMEELGFPVTSMNIMKNTRIPLFMVTVAVDVQLGLLKQKVQYLAYTKITWEHYVNKRRVTQCHRCQEWGHATSNCFVSPNCLKCAEGHLTKDCTKSRDVPAKCYNCGGDHPANATVCEEYKKRLQKHTNKSKRTSPREIEATNRVPDIEDVTQFPVMKRLHSVEPQAMVSRKPTAQRLAWGQQQANLGTKAFSLDDAGILTNIQNNANSNDPSTSSISELISLTNIIKEINNICDIKKMLHAAKELKVQLLQCMCTWNANGLRNKIQEVEEFLARRKIDILLINETKLNPKIKLKIRNYTCIRKDRDNSAGGVAILIRNNVPVSIVNLSDILSIECICVKLVSNIHIIAAYSKPDSCFTEEEIQTLLDIGNKVIMIGDLNARHLAWNCHINNRKGVVLKKYSLKHNCTIMFPSEPTHYPENQTTPTTIDIGINKNIGNISGLKVIHELSSDHKPVMFTLGSQHKDIFTKTTYNYKKADWDKFRQLLNKKITITSNITTSEELEKTVQSYTNILQHCIKHTIPTFSSRQSDNSLSEHIINTIRYRNKIRKKWQKTRIIEYKEHSNILTRCIRKAIAEHRNKRWSEQLSKLNPNDNSLWRMTKIFKSEYQTIPTLIKNGIEAITSTEKAHALATQYEQVHSIELKNNTKEQDDIITAVKHYMSNAESNDWHKYTTSPKELLSIIRTLPSKKAPGTDNIQNIIYKNISKKALVQLMYIVNATIKLSHFPSHWKTGNVVAIHKPGKISTDPSSYRPISLLPTMSKIAEKVILKRLDEFESKQKIIINQQFGFRQKHSTVQQIARIVNDVSVNFNKEKVTVMLLLDIEKAFDRVWIDGLIFKMLQYKYPITLVKLTYSYLYHRHFQVNVNGTKSTKHKIRAGVPQGSVLGPKLFNIFINDIPTFPKTEMALFADDTAVYAHSFSAVVAAKQIQLHINMLEKFYDKWKISLNASKTEVIVFTKKRNDRTIFQPIKVYGHPTQPNTAVKYLGMHLDSKLTYRTHINHIIRKVYAVQRKLYPLMVKNSALTVKNKKLIYKMLLRPIMVYAAPIWCSAAPTNLKVLQIHQNKCLRLILSANRYTRIRDLHEVAEIPYVIDYIKELSQHFYEHHLQNNPLIKDLTRIRSYNVPFELKHRLPYQALDIFHTYKD
ncbi:hypothetical protein KPH14_012704, partial [Odynerus spinipes]